MAKNASSPVEDINDCAALRARMAARSLTRLYDDALKPVGLKITQFTLLVAIKRGMPESISVMADLLAMERTTLTRNLSLLEKKGLIKVGPEGYRRARAISLTPEGEAVLDRAIPLWGDVQSRVIVELGEKGWGAASDTLSYLSTKAVQLASE